MQIRGEKDDDVSYGFHSPLCSVVWFGKIFRRSGDRVWFRAELLQIKADSTQIGPIKAFENFALDIPADVEASNFPAVLIWCEAFG